MYHLLIHCSIYADICLVCLILYFNINEKSLVELVWLFMVSILSSFLERKQEAKDSNDDRTFLKLELPSELHVDTNWLFF